MLFDWSKQVLRHSQPINSRSKTKITQAIKWRWRLLELLIGFFFKVKPIAWLKVFSYGLCYWCCIYCGFWLVESVFLRPLLLVLYLLWLLVGWKCFLTAFVIGAVFTVASGWLKVFSYGLCYWCCIYCGFWLVESVFLRPVNWFGFGFRQSSENHSIIVGWVICKLGLPDLWWVLLQRLSVYLSVWWAAVSV